jgi:hypothetical protein
MGRLKNQLIQEEDRGWYSVTRKLVCNNCVSDERLNEFFRERGLEEACQYCELTPEESELRSVPFDDLMEFIAESVYSEFNTANDERIPWEGGYVFGEHVHDTYQLLQDVIGLEASALAFSDILQSLPDESWCRRGFFSLSLREALSEGWEKFTEMVKYESRYLFTLPSNYPAPQLILPVEDQRGLHDEQGLELTFFPTGSKFGIESDLQRENLRHEVLAIPVGSEFEIEYDREEGIPAHEMLDAVGKLVRRLEISRTLSKGTVLFRARVHPACDEHKTAEGLGPPDRDATVANRMSPAGIVMFYGAFDRDTAIWETFDPNRKGAASEAVSVAQWETLSDMLVLDLTALPPTPSIFEDVARELRHGIAFLHEFVGDLSQRSDRDATKEIEYVPTQIVTEYFRRRFLTASGKQLDAILYPSSRVPDGICCVLFIDRYACGVRCESWRNSEQKLSLREDTVEQFLGQVLIASEQ